MQMPTGLAAFMDANEDRNLNYRLKAFFLGASGTGKSELIRALMGKTEDVVEPMQEGKKERWISWLCLKKVKWLGIESTTEPSEPFESTTESSEPFEPTKEPSEPSEPSEPFEPTTEPSEPFEPTTS